MGAPRRKSRLVARRRPGDDADDDASVVQDDSLSEPSVPSDADDDADGEGSESSEADVASQKQNGKAAGKVLARQDTAAADAQSRFENKDADTALMLNGLTIADGSEQVEEIVFDQVPDVRLPLTGPAVDGSDAAAKSESLAEKRRREHEEYKKRRDADPAFVPNRGGFYMHDERSVGANQNSNGYKTASRGRGRGRGGFNSHFDHAAPTEEGPWIHDLHETLSSNNASKTETSQTAADTAPEHQLRPVVKPLSNPPPNRTFSSSAQVGVIQLRVLLPGMHDPIVFSSVPAMQHTRLPHHRPPLRRDKPVRISLPDKTPMYIFPAVDRSFIFIPRALRPNQQGFGRTRGRGSLGGPGGYRSGRNSIYGGSVYSPSVAMSRRSSFARERDGMVSPAMSVMSRMTGMTGPVVRLPHGGTPSQGPTPVHFGHQAPYKPGPSIHLPQAANYSNIPMHQPRPQKAVAVADIEPAPYNFAQGQSAQQPFAHQVPPQFGDPAMARRTSYPSQRGTPLSNIPERAIHAQPFQPYPQASYPPQMGPAMAPPHMMQQVPQQQMYYPQQNYASNMYYYPQGPPQQAPPPTQAQYNPYIPSAPPPAAPAPAPEAGSQPGTVAHETNGMVYYYDPNQLAADAAAQQATMPYQQMQYGGMGSNYMMPPQGAMYYPPPPP